MTYFKAFTEGCNLYRPIAPPTIRQHLTPSFLLPHWC